MATTEDEVNVKVGANVTGLTAGMQKAATDVKHGTLAIRESFAGLGSIVERLSVPFAAFAGIIGGGKLFAEAISATKEWTDESVKLARTLGITTEEASVLAVAIDDLFLSSDVYLKAVQMMTRHVADGGKAFRNIGINIHDANGRLKDSPALLQEVLDKLNGLAQGTDRNAAGLSIFGRSWGEVQPLLKLTAERMEEAKTKAEELGLVVGGEAVAANLRYKTALQDVHDVFLGLKLAIGREVMPALSSMAEFFAQYGPDAVRSMTFALQELRSAFAGIAFVLNVIGNLLVGTVTQMADFASTSAAFFINLARGDVSGALEVVKDGLTEMKEDFLTTFNAIGDDANTLGDKIDAIWAPSKKSSGTRVGKTGAGAFTPPPPPKEHVDMKAWTEAEAFAKSYYEYNLELAHDDLEAKRSIAAQWLKRQGDVYGEASKEYLDQARELDKIDEEIRKKKAKGEDDEMHRQNKLLAEQARINQGILADIQKAWGDTFDHISKIVGDAFSGVLRGTETIQAAWRRMQDNILSSTLTNIADGLKAFLIAEVTKRAFGAATAKKNIFNYAWEAAAGAFSSTAAIPIIGPFLAPAAGALAAAAVLAFGANVSSAAGGWGTVPSDQLAMIHKNEMVLPASLAGKVRDMTEGGGGSVTHNLTIVATDAKSFADMLDNHDSVLVRKLTQLGIDGRFKFAGAR